MACNVDPHVLKHFEKLSSDQSGPEAGLLVGRDQLGARIAVFACVPSQDAGDSQAVKLLGGSKIQIDVDKLAAEAEELVRMSVGGVTVLGAYLHAPKVVFQAAQAPMRALFAAIRGHAKQLSLGVATGGMVLLCADSFSPGSVVAWTSGAQGAALKAAELQHAELAKSFHLAKVHLQLDGTTLAAAPGGGTLRSTLEGALDSVVARLSDARFVLTDAKADAPFDGWGKVRDAFGGGAAPGLSGLKVTTLIPPPCAATQQPPPRTRGHEAAGVWRLGGSVAVCAWVSEHDTWDCLSTLLRGDLTCTLAARMLHATDAAADTLEAAPSASAAKAGDVEGSFLVDDVAPGAAATTTLRLPSRALVRLSPTNMPLCCYVSPGESVETVAGDVKDLLGAANSPSNPKVLESTANAASLCAPSSLARSPSPAKGVSSTRLVLVIALLFVLLLVSYLLFALFVASQPQEPRLPLHDEAAAEQLGSSGIPNEL